VTTTGLALTDDGIRLGYTMEGEGPTLLLIPGLGATRHIYAPIIPGLAQRHRTVVYDPRGTGESDVPRGPYSMERLAADCVAVAQAAGSQRFHLFGASMGGMTAEYVAVLHGECIDRLVLAATGPGRYNAVPADPAATAALLGMGTHTPEDAYRRACTVLYSARFQGAQPGFIEAEVGYRAGHLLDPHGFSAQFRASRESDISGRLTEISAPTLVMHGTDDALVPVESARLLVRAIPTARHHFLAGAGHLFFHEDPQSSIEVISSFLRG